MYDSAARHSFGCVRNSWHPFKRSCGGAHGHRFPFRYAIHTIYAIVGHIFDIKDTLGMTLEILMKCLSSIHNVLFVLSGNTDILVLCPSTATFFNCQSVDVDFVTRPMARAGCQNVLQPATVGGHNQWANKALWIGICALHHRRAVPLAQLPRVPFQLGHPC
jgi:hypothetical protein